jgi:hypothetical protein
MMIEKGRAVRFKRSAAALMAVLSAVLGLNLLFASPAAASAGRWVPYGNDNPIDGSPSHWKCGATRQLLSDIYAQACVIRTPDYSGVQTAVIVRNERPRLASVQAETQIFRRNETDILAYFDYWTCDSSGVARNSWSVCFGKTLRMEDLVWSVGYVNHNPTATATLH